MNDLISRLRDDDYEHSRIGLCREAADTLEAQQAKIDALMLEYCPDEMTCELRAIWAQHQRVAVAHKSQGCSWDTVTDKVTLRILQLIDENFPDYIGRLAADSSGIDLGFDSLDDIEFVMMLEDEYGIEIPDEDAEDIKTVQDAVDLVKRLKKVD